MSPPKTGNNDYVCVHTCDIIDYNCNRGVSNVTGDQAPKASTKSGSCKQGMKM